MTAKLGGVARFIRGVTFKPEDVVPLETTGSVHCMRTKNVQSELDTKDVWAIPSSLVRRKDQFLQEGDLLISSANSWNLVGKACWVPALPSETTFGGFISVLRADPGKVDARYLFHWFTSSRTQATLRSFGQKTTNISNLNISRCEELELPLPTLEEQRRIAALLDQAEELRAKRRAAITLLEQLPEAIFLELFGDPKTNPKGWPTSHRLSDFADLVSGITKGRKLKGQAVREIPYMAVANVQDKRLNLESVKSIEATEDEINRYRLQRDDLLLTEGGDPDKLGRGTLWNNELPEVIHQNHVFRVRLTTDKMSPLYLSWLIGSAYGKAYFLRQAKQTTGIATINMGQLKEFPLLLPPAKLQFQFAERVKAIHRAKVAQQSALGHLNGLITALQAGAFGHEPKKQISNSFRTAEKANSELPSSSSVIDQLIESYRDVNLEALGAARKAIDFPELAGIRLAREGMEWSTALSGMLAKQTEMSALMAGVIKPPRFTAFASFGAVNGIAKLIEDSLFPSRKLTSLIDSIAASQLTGMGGALESIRRLTVANSLDTSVAHMMAGFAKHQSAIDVITQGWRNSMWNDIQKSSLMFERLQTSSIPSEILEIGSLERFNAVRLLHSTTQDRIWEEDPEADTAIEIVRTEYLDSVEAGLQAIDPRLLKMFQGAKLAGKSQNVDRARHVAVSLREMTTHLLHILAPTAAIKSWSTSESDFANGKPTRASRIRFIYSRYGSEVLDFFEGDIKEAIKWIDRINGETHNLDGFESDGAIEALIARFEGIALSLIRGARGFE